MANISDFISNINLKGYYYIITHRYKKKKIKQSERIFCDINKQKRLTIKV